MHSLAPFLLVGSAIAAALPQPAVTTVSPFCAVVTKVVTLAKAQSTATAFCSSYLKLSPASTVVTASYVLTTDYPCYAPIQTVKRDASPNAIEISNDLSKRAVGKPPCFKAYSSAAQLSSASSCLHTPAGTTTPASSSTVTDFRIKAAYNSHYATPTLLISTINVFQSIL